MPEILQLKPVREVNLEDLDYHLFGANYDEMAALKLVNETFNQYANYRKTNHDERWKQNDNLYHGWVPQKTWPGTKVPRSSLGIPISFDQVQTVFPIVKAALFDHEPYWFDVKSTQFSTPQESRAAQGALAYFLDTPMDASGINAVDQLTLALHDYLQHGNCVVECGWDASRNTYFAEWVNLRDIYISPSLDVPIIDRSPAVIRRKLITIEEVELLRGQEGFSIPPRGVLNTLSKSKTYEYSDLGKEWQGQLRGEQSSASFNEIDPAQQSIELLCYWSDYRMIWVLNRRYVIYNAKNPYGFKPYVFGTLFFVLGKAYGMSIPDVLEGEQMYIQGLTNFRLDEINLALNQPRSRQRENVTFPAQLAIYPGMVDFVESPDKTQFHPPINITDRSYQETQLAEMRAQKRTGVSQMMSAGVPIASNANRTAGGVQAQSASSNSRLRPIIENFESFVIVPLLYKTQMILNQFIPGFVEQVPAINEEGQSAMVPRQVLGKAVKFKMTAASRASLQSTLAPFVQFITQMTLNEGVMKALQGQGKTVDTDEITEFLQDATNTSKKYKFFRPMSDQEKQAAQQPSPEVMAEMQKAQMEAQVRIKMGEMKADVENAKTAAQAQAAATETSEKSARTILQSLSQQQIEQLKTRAAERVAAMKPKGGTSAKKK